VKYLNCDFGALFTAILTVSALVILVPEKPKPMFQKSMGTLPVSILVCAQPLDAPTFSVPALSLAASGLQVAPEKPLRSLTQAMSLHP
jgi:hypothetical protein